MIRCEGPRGVFVAELDLVVRGQVAGAGPPVEVLAELRVGLDLDLFEVGIPEVVRQLADVRDMSGYH